jgi:hypothetical protein
MPNYRFRQTLTAEVNGERINLKAGDIFEPDGSDNFYINQRTKFRFLARTVEHTKNMFQEITTKPEDNDNAITAGDTQESKD